MGLNNTPLANRLHIGIFGRRNAGKSSFINRLTGSNIAIVSEIAGTTADPVYKSMEIHPIGPCVLIDTAGYDDEGVLGALRVAKTREAAEKCDVAILLAAADQLLAAGDADALKYEMEWISFFNDRKTPWLFVLTKTDLLKGDEKDTLLRFLQPVSAKVYHISSLTGAGFPELLQGLVEIPVDYEEPSLTAHLVKSGDSVLLVMPQDIQAPKGRLILPQVQIIRDLLDNSAVITAATAERLPQALDSLKAPPDLIITDSQIFAQVFALKPESTRITSFSVLLARYKGDARVFAAGAAAIDRLTPADRVLIAEACAHNPLDGDIGRIKIPALLRKKIGEDLQIEVVSGNKFPEDLTPYALVIHCGGCMFNRRHVLSRILKAEKAGVPITNYGIAIAHMAGILPHVEIG
jgi:[FeFe] hydrogenase H-cluster maturation GTPase HydF